MLIYITLKPSDKVSEFIAALSNLLVKFLTKEREESPEKRERLHKGYGIQKKES